MDRKVLIGVGNAGIQSVEIFGPGWAELEEGLSLVNEITSQLRSADATLLHAYDRAAGNLETFLRRTEPV
jgi:hypothetical protein